MSDYRQYVGRRVLLFTDEVTFDGTLERAGRDTLVLGQASAVSDTGERREVDGEVVVPLMSVSWMQVP